MTKLRDFFGGLAIGGALGIAAILIFSPSKRNEWFDEIEEKTQDILVEFNRAANEYKEEMEEDLRTRRQGA